MGVREYINIQYLVSAVLALVVVILGIVACATPWYFTKVDDIQEPNFPNSIEILEYLTHVEADVGISSDCSYGSDCLGSDIERLYEAILAFAILIVIFAFFLVIVFVMLGISFLSVNNKVRLILRIISVILSVLLLLFVLIGWTLLFDHMRALREPTTISCDDDDTVQGSGPYCTFAGESSGFSEYSGASSRWGPHAGWIITLVNTVVVIPILVLAIIGLICGSGKIKNENDYRLFEKQ